MVIVWHCQCIKFNLKVSFKKTVRSFFFNQIYNHNIVNVENAVLCKVTLNDQDLEQIKSSIEELFYFEFVSGMNFCFLLNSSILFET